LELSRESLVVSLLEPLLEVSEEGLDVLVLVLGGLGERGEGRSAKGKSKATRRGRERERRTNLEVPSVPLSLGSPKGGRKSERRKI